MKGETWAPGTGRLIYEEVMLGQESGGSDTESHLL